MASPAGDQWGCSTPEGAFGPPLDHLRGGKHKGSLTSEQRIMGKHEEPLIREIVRNGRWKKKLIKITDNIK